MRLRALGIGLIAFLLSVPSLGLAQTITPLVGYFMFPAPTGNPVVGGVLSLPPYKNVTCQWYRGSGTLITGATSCSSYTLQSADAGVNVYAIITTPVIAIASASSANTNFTSSANSATVGAISAF